MNYREMYQQQGFVSPIDIIDEKAAAHHRVQLERAEKQIGPLHYMAKIHTVLTSAWLVRGVDRYHHHLAEQPALTDLDPAALAARDQAEILYRAVTATS